MKIGNMIPCHRLHWIFLFSYHALLIIDWPGNYSWVSSGWRLTPTGDWSSHASIQALLYSVLCCGWRLTVASKLSVAGSVCLNQALLTVYIVTAAFYAIVSTATMLPPPLSICGNNGRKAPFRDPLETDFREYQSCFTRKSGTDNMLQYWA